MAPQGEAGGAPEESGKGPGSATLAGKAWGEPRKPTLWEKVVSILLCYYGLVIRITIYCNI